MGEPNIIDLKVEIQQLKNAIQLLEEKLTVHFKQHGVCSNSVALCRHEWIQKKEIFPGSASYRQEIWVLKCTKCNEMKPL